MSICDGETKGGYFDAGLAWSDVNYIAISGIANGSFVGSRWLASTGLTGTYRINAFENSPAPTMGVSVSHEFKIKQLPQD